MRVVCMLRVLVIFAVAILEISCGDTFRPIAIPQNPQPPDPKSLHFEVVLTDNGDNNPGASSRIDVSGDTNVGTSNVGLGPVHAVLLPAPNDDRIYVVNQLDNTISAYTSTTAGAVPSTITLPQGTNPVFVETQESANIYVAGKGSGSTGPTVSVISTGQNVVTRTLTASDGIGHNPVAIAETPDAKKLYVANADDGTVTSINTIDKSVNAVITTGANPILIAARADSARVYVLNQGSGTVSAIDTLTDVVLGNYTVGAANYMFYDRNLNRLYLTIPSTVSSTAQLAVVDVTVDPHGISLPTDVDLSAACPAGCVLDSVTALPQGSASGQKVYVSSHQIDNTTCTQLAGAPADSAPCVTTRVTVIQAPTDIVKTTLTMLHTVFVNSQAVGTKTDVPVVSFCNGVRFRRQIASAKDGSRVFVANCDAGGTDIIRTSDDSFVLNLVAPTSAAPALPSQSFPPPQNPVFVVSGR
jgi:YVTN family beta-propeller protein